MMNSESVMLFEILREKTAAWRAHGWACEHYPAISEMLEWAGHPDGAGFQLRVPQFRALEAYWYLRLIEKTPHIRDLYTRLFPKLADRLTALGIPKSAFEAVDFDFETLFAKV